MTMTSLSHTSHVKVVEDGSGALTVGVLPDTRGLLSSAIRSHVIV